jgi:hypothetical protein
MGTMAATATPIDGICCFGCHDLDVVCCELEKGPSASVCGVSLVGLSSGEIVEAAMVGKDGVVGASAAIGGNIPGNRGIVQLAGTAMTCNVDALKSAALQSHTLLSALVRHEQTGKPVGCLHGCCSSRGGAALPLLRARDLADTRAPFNTLGCSNTQEVEFRSPMWRPCRKRSANATGLSNRITKPCSVIRTAKCFRSRHPTVIAAYRDVTGLQ